MGLFILLLFLSAAQATHDWDYLIFTQHWPTTVCIQWKTEGQAHTCALPHKKVWTVHGLWPTKTGSHGPFFCNASLHFDANALNPIVDRLEESWINIDMPTPLYSFWQYEWKKHGTCAAMLPALDKEFKYFNQGLEWVDQFNMEPALTSGGVKEGTSYTAQQVWAAVKAHYGKSPTVHCFTDSVSKKTYLFEIRLCFDKNLTLIDCPEHKGTGFLANCPSGEVVYPAPVPQVGSKKTSSKWLLDALYVIRWLQWITH